MDYQCTCAEDNANYEAITVRYLRAICAFEFGLPFSHPFFSADYREGEDPDDALLRLFEQEREHHDGEFETVQVLIHG
jgi:hypothetical protein